MDYVIVHNPAKVRTNLFKKSNIEAELKRFGAREIVLPTVTSITLLAIKRAEAKAGRKLSFAEAATPDTSHLELMRPGKCNEATKTIGRFWKRKNARRNGFPVEICSETKSN